MKENARIGTITCDMVIDVMKGLSIELVAPRRIMLVFKNPGKDFVRKMPKSVMKHYKALFTTYITLLLWSLLLKFMTYNPVS